MGTRLELRSVDPTANPYLAMAVLLEVGLEGIQNKIEAPAPVESNIYAMSDEERREAGITDLPSTLHNALKALREDEVVRAALGDHIYTNFLEAKKIEWASYATYVSQWEIDNYLICIKQRTPTGPLFTSRETRKRVMVQWSEVVWEETVSA